MHRYNQTNILTIDIEDWYSDLDIKYWNYFEDRIVQNTDYILKILRERDTQATFFVLGYYAKRYPDLIEKIKDDNHEIASHGFSHTPITNQTPKQFEEDLLKSIRIIEKITANRVLGFRAPFFTLIKATSWAIDIMKKLGLIYDSSIFPFRIYKYGVPNAPVFPYHISSTNIEKNDPDEEFLEFPLSIYKIPVIKKNIPIAGGFYLRFFPYRFIAYGIKKINKLKNPAICYIHPWEFDHAHPRIKSIVWYNYYRLHVVEKKFKKLLNDFRFTTIKNWIKHEM